MPTEDESVLKQVAVRNEAGDQLTLTVRRAGESCLIEAKDVPATLSQGLRDDIASKTSGPIPNERISEDWRALLGSLDEGGWKSHEMLSSTIGFSATDGRVISRLISPTSPSEEALDIHRGMHRRIAGMFERIASEAAADIRRLAGEGRHTEAFARLREAESNGVGSIGGPSLELIQAICGIDRHALPDEDAFHLWVVRVSEKSRGRVYDSLEEDIQVVEREFGARLDAQAANSLLLVRAEMAEYSKKPEVAYARYRDLLARGGLDARLRAFAHWGTFRLAAHPVAQQAQLAADAFLEAGDRLQAAKCCGSAANALASTEPAKALEWIDKGILALDDDKTIGADSRAGLLHARAEILLDRGDLEKAFADAVTAIQIRRQLTGVEDALTSSLHLAALIAQERGKPEDAQRLQAEAEALAPRASDETRLRARFAQAQGDVATLVSFHNEVLTSDNPRLTVDSLLALGIAHMTGSLTDALGYFESALRLAEEHLPLARDSSLLALIESCIGQSYSIHSDRGKAVEWFKKAVAHDPGESTARQNLAAHLMTEKRWAELAEFMEAQMKVFGEAPVMLYGYGRALLGVGRARAAAKTLHRAKTLCTDPSLAKQIDEWLNRAIEAPTEPEEPHVSAKKVAPISSEEFEAKLDAFAFFIKTERRMSFWRLDKNDKQRKLVANPEQHGKLLLHSFLRGALGDEVSILDELTTGAGRIDLWIEVPGGGRFVVELKMCGEGYAANYAATGVDQLTHYMENKNSHLGFLVVFDCRRRDFGKGIDKRTKAGANTIVTVFVDITPDVVAKAEKRPGAASRRRGGR